MHTLPPELAHGVARGDPAALYHAGRHAATERRHLEAWGWFERAARAGVLDAELELGLLRVFGVLEIGSHAEARARIESAWRRGLAAAAYWTGVLALADTAPRSQDLAREALLAAAKNRDGRVLLGAAVAGMSHPDPALAQSAQALLEYLAQHGNALAADILAQLEAADQEALTATDVAEILAPAPDLPEPDQIEALLAHALVRPLPRARCLEESIGLIQFDDAFHPAEAIALTQLAKHRLEPARVVHPLTGEPMRHPHRTSRKANLDAIRLDFLVRSFECRMAAASGLPLDHAEPLNVLHYRPGEEYRLHGDFLPQGELASDPFGQRCVTVLAYLNEVVEGGATAFPKVDQRISPQCGRIIVFRSADAQGQPLPMAVHAGEPVTAGEKWLASLWLRQRPVREF